MWRDDDPLGNDLREVGEKLAVARFHLRPAQASGVDEFGHDEIGLHGQHLLAIIVRTARVSPGDNCPCCVRPTPR